MCAHLYVALSSCDGELKHLMGKQDGTLVESSHTLAIFGWCGISDCVNGLIVIV